MEKDIHLDTVVTISFFLKYFTDNKSDWRKLLSEAIEELTDEEW